MHALSASELLTAWERGLPESSVERGLTLLAAACPEASRESLAKLPLGRRDARLLTLREWTFGPQFVSLTACTRCGETLEFTFTAGEIRAAEGAEPPGAISLTAGDYEVWFRLPDSSDLAAVLDCPEPAAARPLLLGRCLLEARRRSGEKASEPLPGEVIRAVADHMAKADPQADLQFALSCPACGHGWESTFDIGSFFWEEIQSWAGRVLREVHWLASAYGWSEAEILALSPRRRQFYLEMVGG